MGGPLTACRLRTVPSFAIRACKITVPTTCACRACVGYRGVTWWTSRPWATPEETVTFCWSLGCAAGMLLVRALGALADKPRTGGSAVSTGVATSFLASFVATVIGGCNTSLLLAGFSVPAGVGGLAAALWSFGFACLSAGRFGAVAIAD